MEASRFSCGYREGAQATRMAATLSTAKLDARYAQQSQSRNAVSQFTPQSRSPMATGQESKGMGMTEPQDNLAREREEIASRVAAFRATQEKFQREREEYFVTTLENARHTSPRPPHWHWSDQSNTL